MWAWCAVLFSCGERPPPADLFKEYGLTAENIAAHAEALLK